MTAQHVVSQGIFIQPAPLEKQHTGRRLFVSDPTTQDAMDPKGFCLGSQDVDETGAGSGIVAEILVHQDHREQARAPKMRCKVILGR